jgi:hypothetical protein
MDTQTRIILACLTLYNYVRSQEGESADIWLNTEVDRVVPDVQPAVQYPPMSTSSTVSSKKMDKFRDELAAKMWTQYQLYLKDGAIESVEAI